MHPQRRVPVRRLSAFIQSVTVYSKDMMKKGLTYTALGMTLTVAAVGGLFLAARPDGKTAAILSGRNGFHLPQGMVIDAPFDGTVFPPDLAAPTFRWHTAGTAADTWLVEIAFTSGKSRVTALTDASCWTPSPRTWKKIRARCGQQPATVTVFGVNSQSLSVIVCGASLSIRISSDPVDAPIFYRAVNLPFGEAVKDPSRIRWCLGRVSSPKPPPVVLEKMPVCGNCHSFSRDGTVMGMDVDYANDKGSYVTCKVEPEIDLTPDKIITWSDYRRADGVPTFGLLSQVSPDGRYVVSTVKDRSVFLATPGLDFSQLFFPIQGILAVYDRQTGTFAALPGADDSAYVQSNPAWSPDGRTIVFARSLAYRLKKAVRKDAVLLRRDECEEFLNGSTTFQYDLYRIPFNGGKGGLAEPLQGASKNGKSNFFPKFSPDGRWIVFCKAASFMLLQPDSELYIVPAAGGEARRLNCNLSRMNSWHSWSPNGRWLVFSSKSGTPFTRLFLTHIDEQGISTPAVLLDAFARPGRAANIPEFVNLRAHGLRRIREQFIDEISFVRAGNAFREGGDPDQAVAQYRHALEMNPRCMEAWVNMGAALCDKKAFAEAADSLRHAYRLAPANAVVCFNLSVFYAQQSNFDEAIRWAGESVRLDPGSAGAQSNLGIFLFEKGRLDEALAHLLEAVRLDPEKTNAYFPLGRIMVRKGRLVDAVRCYGEAVRLAPDSRSLNALAWILATAPDPKLRDGKRAVECATRLCELSRYQSPRALDVLAASYAEAERFPEAVRAAARAAEYAAKQGNPRFAAEIQTRLALYRQNKPFHQ